MKICFIFCGIACFLFVITLVLCLSFGNKDDKALRMPAIFIAGLYVVIEIYVSYKYLLRIPASLHQYVIIGQCIFLLIVICIILLLLLSNKYIKKVEENEKNAIIQFQCIREQLQIQATLAKTEKQRKIIQELYEIARISDPVSSPDIAAENEKIYTLSTKLSDLDDQQLKDYSDWIKKLFEIRNIKNKKKKG